MTKSTYINLNFNGGELSPLLDGRVDYPKYASGAKQMLNWVPTVYGPMTKRPGTVYVDEITFGSSEPPALIAFEFNEQQSYMLALIDNEMKFFYGDGALTKLGVPFTLSTPYSASESSAVQVAQTGDIMYFTHPNHPPYKLSRVAVDEFTFEPVVFVNGPFNDENTTDTTVTIAGSIDVGGNGSLTSSTDLFTADDVGSYFKISYVPTSFYETWSPDSHDFNGVDITYTLGDFLVYLGNVYEVTGADSGSLPRRTGRRSPLHEEGEESDGSLLLTYVGTDYGYVEITAYNNPTNVVHQVVRALPRNATAAPTKSWAFGSFNKRNGYPRSLTFHQQRLVYGGTLTAPQTVYGSEINLFENFEAGTADDKAYQFTIAATKQNAINWLVSNQTMQIGTGGSEFDASSTGSTITPTDIAVDRINTDGSSKGVDALVSNGFTLFVQGGGKKLRELRYDDNTNRTYARDLNKVANQVSESGSITRMAYQGEPYQIIWVIAGSDLYGLTYETDEEVYAWHRHSIGGELGSVATIPHNFKDRLWLTVKRTNSTGSYWAIEYLSEFFSIGASIEDGIFLDSALTYDGRNTDGTTITVTSNFNFEVGTVCRASASNAIFSGASPGDRYRLYSGSLRVDLEFIAIVGGPSGADFTILTTFPDELKSTPTPDWSIVLLTLTGLDHLEGLEVGILNNGSVEQTKIVSGGAITLDQYTGYCHVGLPLESIWQSMRIDGGSQEGVGQAKSKHLKNIVIRLLNSGAGLMYGRGELSNGAPVDGDYGLSPVRRASDLMDSPPSLISSDTPVESFPGGHSKEFFVRLKHSKPTPCTVVAFMSQLSTNER